VECFRDFERTYEVISWRISNLDSTAFVRRLFKNPYFEAPVPIFNRMVYEWLSKENVNDCECPPLAIALRMFGESPPSLRCRWKPIIQHLIHLGTDLQRGFISKTTLLDDLMSVVEYSFESRSLGGEWINILLESGVNVADYLRTEYRLHFDSSKSLPMMQEFWETDYRPRYLIISEETLSISWEWFIDPEGKAFDLLEEFKNSGPGRHDEWFDGYQPILALNWPFFYPRWPCFLKYESYLVDDEEIEILRHAKARFERRWNKKAMKLARAQGITHRGPKLPGAWID
jgi:hypothetical protein